MIKVSVIVPVYKVPLDYLKECFDSLLAQTMQECEFIVISDGAPEAECSICDAYATKDPRFLFFRREHAGVSAARNFGIDQAQGEYLTFVDSDDWIEPSNIECAYNFAIKNQSDIVFWDLTFHKESTYSATSCFNQEISLLNSNEISIYTKNIIHPSISTSIPAYTVCKLLKKSLLTQNNITFHPNLSIGEDRVFNLSVLKVSSRISYIHKEFYHYRIFHSSTINQFQKHLFDKYLSYIIELQSVSEENYAKQISNETIITFYNCILKIHFSKTSPKEKLEEFKYLKNLIHTNTFNKLIQNTDENLPKPAIKLEILLMKKKISLFFSLRILKFRIVSFFQSFL